MIENIKNYAKKYAKITPDCEDYVMNIINNHQDHQRIDDISIRYCVLDYIRFMKGYEIWKNDYWEHNIYPKEGELRVCRIEDYNYLSSKPSCWSGQIIPYIPNNTPELRVGKFSCEVYAWIKQNLWAEMNEKSFEGLSIWDYDPENILLWSKNGTISLASNAYIKSSLIRWSFIPKFTH